MNRYSTIMFATLFSGACLLQAQSNPLTTEVKQGYNQVKRNLLAMADKMPDEDYSFKPTGEIQTFAQRVAHISDANLRSCAAIKGERKQAEASSKTSKADLVMALKDAFAYCDTLFDSVTDADAMKMMSGRGGQRSELASLYGVVIHSNEVYGYMSVYLRLKGIVPPSTENMGRGRRGGR